MIYAIAFTKKTTANKTVYLLKNGQFAAVNNTHEMVKTWKTRTGALKKWLSLCNQVSAYSTGSEIVSWMGQ